MSKIDTIESTPSESDNRIASCSGALDVAKVLVTLLVVIGHVVYYNYTECRFPQQQTSSILAAFCDVIYYFHMPAFFAISGGVFYLTYEHFKKYPTFGKIIKNKFRRLMLPYYLCIAVIFIPLGLFLHFPDATNYPDLLLRKYFLIGDMGWLWFLPVLFMIFGITYFLLKPLRKHTTAVFVVLGILSMFSILLPLKIIPLQIFTPPHLICKHLFYFCLGYFVCSLFISGKVSSHKKMFAYMGGAFAMLAAANITFIYKLPYLPLLTNFLLAILGTLGILTLSLCLSFNDRLIKSKWFSVLKRHSFGIYLFHEIFLLLLFNYFSEFSISPYIAFTIGCMVSIAGGLLISVISSKVPYLKGVLGFKSRPAYIQNISIK